MLPSLFLPLKTSLYQDEAEAICLLVFGSCLGKYKLFIVMVTVRQW